jgi:hypothetical protein
MDSHTSIPSDSSEKSSSVEPILFPNNHQLYTPESITYIHPQLLSSQPVLSHNIPSQPIFPHNIPSQPILPQNIPSQPIFPNIFGAPQSMPDNNQSPSMMGQHYIYYPTLNPIYGPLVNKPSKYDPGTTFFTSMITPLSNLVSHTGSSGSVEFVMRRKNKTVTLQWEPFTATIAVNGIAYLTVAQSLSNMPPYPISNCIFIDYKGRGRMTRIEIDPDSRKDNIKFYLNSDSSSDGIIMGDSIKVHGSSVTWTL